MHRLFLTAVLVALPALAASQPVLDETLWSVSVSAGFDPTLSGDATTTVSGTVGGTPIVLGNVGFSDVYGTLARWRLSVGYSLDDRSEVLGAFAYSTGDGSRQTVGVAPGPALVGEFTDLGEKTVEVGYRYFLPAQERFLPHLTAWGGFTRVGRINAGLSVPAVSIELTNLPVFDSSTAGTLAIAGGAILPLTRRVGITADVGLRWRGALNSANALVGTGLEEIDRDSSRWSLPVMFGAVLRFGDLP